MGKMKFPSLDKSKLVVTTLQDDDEEKRYWFSCTPEERLEAMELMRQLVHGYDPSTARLQRVLEVVQRQQD